MDKIDKLIKLIDDYTRLIKQIIDKNKGIDRQQDMMLNIRVILLERFYYNSAAIKVLLDLFKIDQNYKIPLALLLRTGLSDCLTYFYFLLIEMENCTNYELRNNKIKQFLAGHLHHLKREIERKVETQKITKKQSDQEWQNIQHLYSDYFDPSGELIKCNNITNSAIRKKLEADPILEWAASSFEGYDLFSKFEHIGALTYDLQKVHQSNMDLHIDGIIMSTILIYYGVETIAKSMHEYQDLKVIFDELNKDLSNL